MPLLKDEVSSCITSAVDASIQPLLSELEQKISDHSVALVTKLTEATNQVYR